MSKQDRIKQILINFIKFAPNDQTDQRLDEVVKRIMWVTDTGNNNN